MGNDDIKWEHFAVVNGVQGILTMWPKDTFICETLVRNTSFVRVKERYKKNNMSIVILNV